jgi:hypothetical protein
MSGYLLAALIACVLLDMLGVLYEPSSSSKVTFQKVAQIRSA